MEVSYFTLLALSAFGLGACPFSVWIGRWVLGKDIRDYGDGKFSFVASLEGFEPTTRCLEGSRSVQLSYRDKLFISQM